MPQAMSLRAQPANGLMQQFTDKICDIILYSSFSDKEPARRRRSQAKSMRQLAETAALQGKKCKVYCPIPVRS